MTDYTNPNDQWTNAQIMARCEDLEEECAALAEALGGDTGSLGRRAVMAIRLSTAAQEVLGLRAWLGDEDAPDWPVSERAQRALRVAMRALALPYPGGEDVCWSTLPQGQDEPFTIDHVVAWLDAFGGVLRGAALGHDLTSRALTDLQRDVAGMRRLLGLPT